MNVKKKRLLTLGLFIVMVAAIFVYSISYVDKEKFSSEYTQTTLINEESDIVK